MLENCFQNMKRFSLIKLIPVLIHLTYWYYNTPSLELSCLHQISPWRTETPRQHNPHDFLHPFPYIFLCLATHHRYWIYLPICQSKPVKFIIKLYTDHKNLWFKHATHQKTESLRALFLSKLDNLVNGNSIFNKRCLETSAKWWELFSFYNPTCAYNHPSILHQKFVPSDEPISTSILPSYFFTKPSLQSPITLLFSIAQWFPTSLFLRTAIPTIYTKSISSNSAI